VATSTSAAAKTAPSGAIVHVVIASIVTVIRSTIASSHFSRCFSSTSRELDFNLTAKNALSMQSVLSLFSISWLLIRKNRSRLRKTTKYLTFVTFTFFKLKSLNLIYLSFCLFLTKLEKLFVLKKEVDLNKEPREVGAWKTNLNLNQLTLCIET